MLASDTAGQSEVAELAPDAVAVYPAADSATIARKLNDWLNSPEKLKLAKAAALRAAEKTFCWEHTAPRLVASVREALATK